ncbi:hypothetical protein OTSKARP_0842 [Orientia tsutsugamushi str. Karp]|nr:hypothetical protein OTSKARP_0842 [Orientia tsutsugamushi str. Karp]
MKPYACMIETRSALLRAMVLHSISKYILSLTKFVVKPTPNATQVSLEHIRDDIKPLVIKIYAFHQVYYNSIVMSLYRVCPSNIIT